MQLDKYICSSFDIFRIPKSWVLVEFSNLFGSSSDILVDTLVVLHSFLVASVTFSTVEALDTYELLE